MTPLDDELRTALSSHTESVRLSPDFVSGVERRARGMRRQRVAASVAGSALAVAALGVGGPMLASTLTSSPNDRAPVATAPPTSVRTADDRYVLDPASPWPYRGEESVRAQGDLDAYEVQWSAAHGLLTDDVTLVPLFGQVYEPSATPELVYLVTTSSGERWWGVAQATESGPELAVDQRLAEGTRALVAALPGDEVGRLLVVAAPGVTDLEYAPDGASEWSALTSIADGVATGPLDGTAATDRYRVLGPEGDVLADGPAPDLAGAPSPGEGPGTGTPAAVDPAPYALDLADPWAYRGPAELVQHPDLAVQDGRLFEAGGTGRSDGSWSDRPLLAVERPDGLSVLVVLHARGGEAVVTTTWQRQDEAPQQHEQAARSGDLVLQSYLPQSDGTGVLVALAAPRTGAIETDARGVEQVSNEDGWSMWTMSRSASSGFTGSGSLFLYSQGDGLPFHSEPAQLS